MISTSFISAAADERFKQRSSSYFLLHTSCNKGASNLVPASLPPSPHPLSAPPPLSSLPPSHPSDEKEHSSPFPRNISAASLGSLITHHHNANHSHPAEPSVTDPLMSTILAPGDVDTRIDMEKNEVQVSLGLSFIFKTFVFVLVLTFRVVSVRSRRSRPWCLEFLVPNPNMS